MSILTEDAYEDYLSHNKFNGGGTMDEFVEHLLTDDEFNDKWSSGCTEDLSETERIQIWNKKFPNHDPLLPVMREVLYRETPKRKLK